MKCSKCKLVKQPIDFYKDISRKSKLTPYCKICISQYQKTEHFKKINKKAHKKYNQKDYVKKLAVIRTAKWAVNNRDKVRAKNNAYYAKIKHSPLVKLKKVIRSLAYRAVKHKVKSSIDYLGCTQEFFKIYLESLFEPGMTWDNFGKNGWTIDHIRPIYSFNLEIQDEVLKCTHYTNLRPMWHKDNCKKAVLDKKLAVNKLPEFES